MRQEFHVGNPPNLTEGAHLDVTLGHRESQSKHHSTTWCCCLSPDCLAEEQVLAIADTMGKGKSPRAGLVLPRGVKSSTSQSFLKTGLYFEK